MKLFIRSLTSPAIIISFFFISLSIISYGEGSKQVYIVNENTGFRSCNDFVTKCNDGNGDRTPFAVYDCDEVHRLYFYKLNPSEVIYLGFKGSGAGFGNHIVFRIKDLAGNIVYDEINLPTSGTGYIADISQARNGPNQIPGTVGGYTAINFHPSATGKFYIEFNRKNNSGNVTTGVFNIDLLDITVYDTVSSQVKNGRLYSKAWQFYTTNGMGGGYSGTNYIYSSDSIITNATFSSMFGGVWVQFCNQTGCGNTGNFENDRKSLNNQQVLLPSYPIFLNPPDPAIWPPAQILGSIVGTPWYEQFCSGQFTFHVNVNKAGNVSVNLSFGSPYTDRSLPMSVVVGENIIPWDGMDGSLTPVPIPNNTPITLSVTYINGLTNLPLYDVETNSNGFIIGLTSPSGPTPLVYYDDSNIPGGSVNLTGCLSPPGCHSWEFGWGDHHTINTWWYTVSSSTALTPTVQHRQPQPLTFNQTAQSLCAGTSNVTFSVTPDPNTEVYHWNYTGTGATITQATPGSSTVTVSFTTDATSGNMEVYGTNTNCSSYPSSTVTLPVTIKPIPALTTSLSFGTCSGVDYSIPLTSSVPGSTFSWTSPPPSCTPNITPPCPTGNTGSTITGNVTVIGILQGSITYFVTPSANGCTGVTKDLVVNVAPLPDLSTNPVSPSSVCSGQTTNIVLQSSFATTTFSWPAPVCSNILVPPPPGSGALIADPLQLASNTIPGSVIYSITPLNGSCAGVPVNHTVVVHPLPVPTITGSLNFDVCSRASETYTTESSMSNYSWSISPGGVINSGQGSNSINVTWNTVGSQTVQVTYTNADNCNPVTPTVQNVNVKPIPHLTNAAPSPICSAGNFSVTLVPDVTGGDFTWTATCNPVGSVTGFTAAQTTNVTQISDILTNTTFAIGTVTYLITPHANGCDGPPTPFSVDVNPKPDVLFTSPPLNPQEVCSGSASVPVPLQSNVTLPVISYGWVAQAFDPVNPTTDISGFTTPNSGNTIPGENITSTLLNPGVIKYTVTATLSAGGAVCPGDPYQYQMIINPSPTVALNPSDPAGQTICSGETSQPITFTPNVTPTIYAWQAVEIVGVSGATASGTTDNIPAMTLTTTGAAQGHVRYQVTPTYQGGGSFQCPGGVSYSTIFVNPLPTPQFTVTSPVCEFGPPVQYQTASVADHSYLWDITGANTISGETTSQVTVSWGAAGTGTLRVRETNSITGCIQHYPPIGQPPLQVVLQQRPVPSLTGPSSICEASSGNLYQTDAGTNHDYTWLIDGGIITAGGDGFPTATVTWTNPGTTNWIEVNYINALGCPGYPPHRDIIQVNPLPVSSFTGTTTVCQLHPDAYLYPAESGPACSYSWSITPSSAGSIANATVSPASVTWNTTGNASLRLDAITSFGCTSFSSQPITINPRPDVSITPCFDLVTTRSAKRFLLKGGIPLLTATPLQGEYLINPATVALVAEGSNFYFDPSLVPGTNTVNFNLYYKYTSSQFGCPSTSPNPVTITVHGANPACSSTMTDYRDNTTYRTSFVGGKCWMMENLRYGNPLTPTTTVQTDNCVAEKYCLSADPNCSTYGGFYQWDELIQYGVTASPEYQGVCPPGWHIPSAADFQALIDENQGNAMAGATLKDLNLSPRGFEALLDGMYYLNTAWAFTSAVPAGTMFWTSTPGSGNKIVTRGMNNMVPSVSLYETSRVNAFPVRCVKD